MLDQLVWGGVLSPVSVILLLGPAGSQLALRWDLGEAGE